MNAKLNSMRAAAALCVAMLVCTLSAGAQDKPAAAAAPLPVCKLAPDGRSLAVEPCRPAPSRNFTQRRAVPQTIERMPAPPTAARAPGAAPPAVLPSTPPALNTPARPPAGAPTTPQALGGCDGGGCRDVNGVRYQGPAGGTFVNPAGRPCTSNGTTVQCF